MLLSEHEPTGPTEAADVARVRTLVQTVEDPWSRANPLHLTGSAVIVHPATQRVLLRWHDRHHTWLQVGGHGDPGERDPLEVALREAAEETGLTDLAPWPTKNVVHVVVVAVPARSDEPAHEHADVRFVLATDRPETVRPEHPQAPLRWLSFAEARELTAADNLSETLARVQRLLAALR